MPALRVLATSAIPMPSTGPNKSPADSVNAVLGKGSTVTTTWAARKASGNPASRGGPVAKLQRGGQRNKGTSATRITVTAAIAATRRRGIWLAVAVTAAATVRSVSTTGFTFIKGTGR